MLTKYTICLGDVYTSVPNDRITETAKRVGMAGPLFECAAKGVHLASWIAKNPEAHTAEQKSLGYWEITGLTGEGKTADRYTVGYFIPHTVDKAEVAEEIRTIYGKSAALVKPPFGRRDTSMKTEYLSHIKAKHRGDSPEFVQDLVNECAEAFAELASGSSLQDKYLEIRQRLQVMYGARVS